MTKQKTCNMKYLILTIFILTFVACDKKDNDNDQYGAYLSSILIIKVQDNEGSNLLDDTIDGHYCLEEIKTYIIEDGKKVEYLSIGLDRRKQIAYYNGALKLYLANPGFSDEKKISSIDTYIQFGNRPMDKITGWFNVGPNFCRLDSAFFNDRLIYVENPNAKEEIFPIIQIEPNNK